MPNKIKGNNTYITLPLKGGQPLLVSRNAIQKKNKNSKKESGSLPSSWSDAMRLTGPWESPPIL